jgi:hypothetical protein
VIVTSSSTLCAEDAAGCSSPPATAAPTEARPGRTGARSAHRCPAGNYNGTPAGTAIPHEAEATPTG